MNTSASPAVRNAMEWHSRYEAVDCPACGPAASRVLFQAHDWYYRRAECFSLRQCESCRLVYVSPRPRVEYLGDYYPENYEAHLPPPPAPPPMGGTWRDRLRQSALAAALHYPLPGKLEWMRLPARLFRGRMLRAGYPEWRPHGLVVDVGCGRGDFLFALRRFGWEVYGLDLSARALQATRAKGVPARQCSLADLDWPNQSVDAIVFRDSFEHHPNPVETLQAAARLLRPGGNLIIRFPHFNSFWRRVFGPCWADVSAPRHLYHFTPATLAAMVRSCGFEVLSVHTLASADFSRSLRIWESARAGVTVAERRWARRCDRFVSFGHCLLRARVQ